MKDTIFPMCSSYLSKDIKYSRKESLQDIENQNLVKAIESSKKEYELLKGKSVFKDFQILTIILDTSELPKSWFKIVNNEKVKSFKRTYIIF